MSLSFGVTPNQQNIGQTIRPASTALLTIDSEDRFNSYADKRLAQKPTYNWSPYSFQITKNSSLMNGFFTRLAVTEVVFPWVIPNVNQKTSTIQIGISSTLGGTYTYSLITLNVAFYTPASLAATLQAVIRAGTSLTGFNMVYGTNSKPQFLYNSGAVGSFVTFAPVAYNTPAYPYSNTTKQLFDVLGFNAENTNFGINNAATPHWTESVGTPAVFYAASGDTFAQAIRYVDIVCSQLVYNQALKDTSSSIVNRDALCRLYLTDSTGVLEAETAPVVYPGNAPFILYRDFSYPKQIQWTPNQPVTGALVFEVYDDQGNPLTDSVPYTSAQADWSMTVLVSES